MSIDHLILGVISLYPCSGYDMKAEFEQGAASLLSALSFGSIYPRLKHLEDRGLITTLPNNDVHSNRPRNVYELTAQGWLELASWLEHPSDYPIPMRDELLLKMLFWGSANADRPTLIEHLRTRREESQELLHDIDAWQNNGISFIDEYGALLFTYLKMRIETDNRWIEDTITRLEGPAELPLQDPKWLAVLQKARREKALGHLRTDDALIQDEQ